jgi:hypothetical protein
LANSGRENASAYDFYVAGLADRFLGREKEAQKAFASALESDPSFWRARLEARKPFPVALGTEGRGSQ